MSEFIYKQLTLKANDVVRVTLNRQANVLLVDPTNFDHYKSNKNFYYHGGCARVSPVEISVPRAGTWYVVIDLGGAGGTVEYSCQVLSPS